MFDGSCLAFRSLRWGVESWLHRIPCFGARVMSVSVYLPLSVFGKLCYIIMSLHWHLVNSLCPQSAINDEAINRLPQVECNPLLDELPTVSETVKAIKLLSSGKAPGSDAIPAEIYKAGDPPVAEKLTELFHIMWRKEAIPQDFKDATIIHLFKKKGNPQICDNHRGISLLSIAGKILARVLLNRLNEHLERSGRLPESQCGFRKNRGTIDMIFTARQLQEKCQE